MSSNVGPENSYFEKSDEANIAIELYKKEAELSVHFDKLRTNVLQVSVLGSAAILSFFLSDLENNKSLSLVFSIILILVALVSFVVVWNCTCAHIKHFVWYEELRRHLSRRSLPLRRIENLSNSKRHTPNILFGEYLDDSLNWAAFLSPFACSLVCFLFWLFG